MSDVGTTGPPRIGRREARGQFDQPDRVFVHATGIPEDQCALIATQAVNYARSIMPRLSGNSASNLRPIFGDGYFGIKWMCLVPGTRVLTADLRWVPVETLIAGDSLISPDEEVEGKWRRYRTGYVEAVEVAPKECVAVEFDDGTSVTCTREHPWLANAGGPFKARRQRWVNAVDLDVDDEVAVYFEPWKEDCSKAAGWLAGMFDGEGCLSYGQTANSGTLSVSQRIGPVLDETEQLLKERGFKVGIRDRQTSGLGKKDVQSIEILGGFSEQARFLGSIRPMRLLPKARFEDRPLRAIRRRRVVAVRDVGEQDVVLMGTTTHTYMAEGMASHNSNHVWFQEQGVRPFTMKRLAGKTIPMWINDPLGEVKRKNPKAEQRITADGRRQTKIFRRAGKIGARRTRKDEHGNTVDLGPQSYPGAPGRISMRTPPRWWGSPGRISPGGRIAKRNVGVRWRHPGLPGAHFLHDSLLLAAQMYGIEGAMPIYSTHQKWRGQMVGA